MHRATQAQFDGLDGLTELYQRRAAEEPVKQSKYNLRFIKENIFISFLVTLRSGSAYKHRYTIQPSGSVDQLPSKIMEVKHG
jgi:hypothetical protein